MALATQLEERQRAGVEAFAASRKALVATEEEEEVRAAEAARMALRNKAEAVGKAARDLEAVNVADEAVAELAQEATRQTVTMLQDDSVDVATIGSMVGPYGTTADLVTLIDEETMAETYIEGMVMP
jgi:alkylhydroperoxidase family enzyme